MKATALICVIVLLAIVDLGLGHVDTTWTRITSDNNPRARWEAEGGKNPTSPRMIMTGGEAYQSETSANVIFTDTWEFNFQTEQWLDRTPALSGSYEAHGWRGSSYTESGLKYVTWGGILADLNVLHILQGSTWADETAVFPLTSLTGFVLTVWQGDVYVFGGVPESRVFAENTIWTYKLQSQTAWTAVTVQTESPQGRYFHSGDRTNDGKWVIFGGTADIYSGDHLNDLWVYDIETKTWDRERGTEDCRPTARALHASALDDSGEYLYIHGGVHSGVLSLSDLWVYSFKEGLWYQIESDGWTGGSGARDGHLMSFYNNRLYVFGGDQTDEDSLTQYNDMHKTAELPDCDAGECHMCDSHDGDVGGGLIALFVLLILFLIGCCILLVIAAAFYIYRRRKQTAAARAEERDAGL